MRLGWARRAEEGRGLQCEASLAASPSPGQGQQAGLLEQLSDLGELRVAPNEGCQSLWQHGASMAQATTGGTSRCAQVSSILSTSPFMLARARAYQPAPTR